MITSIGNYNEKRPASNMDTGQKLDQQETPLLSISTKMTMGNSLANSP
jgi:hypothetical protein